MATIEQAEAMTEAWERLSRACDEAACCPTMKAQEVAVFRQMADSFKPAIDGIEEKYWSADGEGMERLAADFDELTAKVREAMRLSEVRSEGSNQV